MSDRQERRTNRPLPTEPVVMDPTLVVPITEQFEEGWGFRSFSSQRRMSRWHIVDGPLRDGLGSRCGVGTGNTSTARLHHTRFVAPQNIERMVGLCQKCVPADTGYQPLSDGDE